MVVDEEQGPKLWIATILSLVLSVIALSLRTTVKIRFKIKPTYDDAALAVALILALCQYSLVFACLSQQLGTAGSMSERHTQWLERRYHISQILLILTLAASKIAMGLLLRQVFALECRLYFLHSLIVAGALGSILAIAVGCDGSVVSISDHDHSDCSNPTGRWAFVTVFDVLTEVMIFATCVWLIRDIQMRCTGKLKVLVAMGSRLSTVVFSLLYITFYRQSTNRTASLILPAIFQQCEVACSIITASILPCFRLLFQPPTASNFSLNPYPAARQFCPFRKASERCVRFRESSWSKIPFNSGSRRPSSSTGQESTLSKVISTNTV